MYTARWRHRTDSATPITLTHITEIQASRIASESARHIEACKCILGIHSANLAPPVGRPTRSGRRGARLGPATGDRGGPAHFREPLFEVTEMYTVR